MDEVRVPIDSADLLVTCAGSGVTMVAIIAGFTLSRYLSIHSEIAGAESSKTEAAARVATAKARARTATAARDRVAIEWVLRKSDDALNYVLRQAIHGGEDGQLDEATMARFAPGLSDLGDDNGAQLLRDWYDEARRVVTYDDWDRLRVVSDRDQPEWSRFKLALPQPFRIEALWFRYFEDTRRTKIKQAEKAAEAAKGGISLPTFRPPRIFMDDPEEGLDREDVVGPSQRELEAAKQDVALAEAELHIAQGRMGRIAQPAGSQRSILWLIAVFGLTAVPSLLLLTPEPANLTYKQGCLVLGLYFAGVLVMFVYFALVARGTRNGRPSTT